MWLVTISIASGSPKRFPISRTVPPTWFRITPSQQCGAADLEVPADGAVLDDAVERPAVDGHGRAVLRARPPPVIVALPPIVVPWTITAHVGTSPIAADAVVAESGPPDVGRAADGRDAAVLDHNVARDVQRCGRRRVQRAVRRDRDAVVDPDGARVRSVHSPVIRSDPYVPAWIVPP